MEQARAARYRASVADATEPLAAIARVAYEEGELGILELLDANRQLVEARLRVLELAAAARLAAIELDRVTGVEVTP
jgi:outer membrane protein, heavy metal efflux system